MVGRMDGAGLATIWSLILRSLPRWHQPFEFSPVEDDIDGAEKLKAPGRFALRGGNQEDWSGLEVLLIPKDYLPLSAVVNRFAQNANCFLGSMKPH